MSVTLALLDYNNPLRKILKFILDELIEYEFEFKKTKARLLFNTDKDNTISLGIEYKNSADLVIVVNLNHKDAISYYETDGTNYYPLSMEWIEHDKEVLATFIKEFNDDYNENTKYRLSRIFSETSYNTSFIQKPTSPIQMKLKELWV